MITPVPVGWTRIATPEELRELLHDPYAFEARVGTIVADAGGVLTHVFWAAAGGPAVVVSAVPAADADDIFARLTDALGTTERLQTTEELQRASTAE